MKQLITLMSIMLMIVSCGTEGTKTKQDSAYDYVEMEECTIPVLKEFNITQIQGKGASGISQYDINISSKDGKAKIKNYLIINIYKESSDNIHDSHIVMREFLTQHNSIDIRSETEYFKFKIIEYGTKNPILNTSNFYLFGNTIVIDIKGLPNKKKRYIKYLLNYCKKTWKLNKGKNNASTSK